MSETIPTETYLRRKVEEALGDFDNWPGTGFHYDELRGRLSAVLGEVVTEAALKERDRCLAWARGVETAAARIRDHGNWNELERAAWDARIRAASDMATFIQNGTEPR